MMIKRYRMRFSAGRVATVLDMEGGDPAAVIPGLIAHFAPGYVLEVVHVS